MSKIDELIEKLCPDGVGYMKLGDVAEYRRGSFPQPYGKSEWYDGEGAMPFVQVADVSNNLQLVKNTKQKISLAAQSKSVFVKKGTVIVTLQGSIGRVAVTQYDSYVDRTLAIFQSYKFEINVKYFAYQLESKFSVEKEFARGSTLKTITKEEFTKFKIPIPPLPIQEEIVRILDKFTSLEAELEAELEARTRQYEYYRNQLLAFEGKEVEWKTLGEIGKCYAGATPRTTVKEYWENGDIPWMSSGEVNYRQVLYTEKYITKLGFEKSSTKMIPANSVVIALAGQGKTRGTVAITRIELCTNQSLCAVVTNNEVNSDYLYYFLKTQYKQLRNVSSGDGTRGGLNLQMIREYKIPVPSIEEQERIVAILDKFDALVNDISVGLPAEIQARKQQYEYYRGKLLMFEPLAIAEVQ